MNNSDINNIHNNTINHTNIQVRIGDIDAYAFIAVWGFVHKTAMRRRIAKSCELARRVARNCEKSSLFLLPVSPKQ